MENGSMQRAFSLPGLREEGTESREAGSFDVSFCFGLEQSQPGLLHVLEALLVLRVSCSLLAEAELHVIGRLGKLAYVRVLALLVARLETVHQEERILPQQCLGVPQLSQPRSRLVVLLEIAQLELFHAFEQPLFLLHAAAADVDSHSRGELGQRPRGLRPSLLAERAETNSGHCWLRLPLPFSVHQRHEELLLLQPLPIGVSVGRVGLGMHYGYAFLDGVIPEDGVLQRLHFLLVLKKALKLAIGLCLVGYGHQLYYYNRAIQGPVVAACVALYFMDHLSNEDSHDHDVQGTIIVPVGPKQKRDLGLKTPKKSRRKPASRSKAKTRAEGEYNEAQESSFHEEGEQKEGERGSEGKMRGADEETMVELQDNGLIQPYEFISQRSPGILSIFFPRRTWRSVTFFLSLAYVLMFFVLIVFNYSRPQTDLSWNCSLYRLQAKYFPRLRHEVELWRVVLSALLHSNIAHFVLDLFALQVYGYFVEWYFGRMRFCAALAASAVYSHFLSCLAQKTSIATTPSAVLFSVLVLKAFFLWEYRNYKKLYERRQFLYILLALIAGINLIPIFVVNNIDYSAQIGGVIVGLCFGVYALATKEEEQSWKTKTLRVLSVFFLIATFAAFVGLVFSESAAEYRALSETIGPRCEGN